MVLFDIDGTLLRTGGAGSRGINRVFEREYGVVGAMDKVNPSGQTDPNILTECFQHGLGRTPSKDEIQKVLDLYLPELKKELAVDEKFRVLPYVNETIDWLTKIDVIMGVATGNVSQAADLKLKRAGLEGVFDFGGYGNDSRHRAELVQKAIDRGRQRSADIAPQDIVVIGDTPLDIKAARDCGVKVIAVATGRYTKSELEVHAPDGCFASLKEFPQWHQNVFGL